MLQAQLAFKFYDHAILTVGIHGADKDDQKGFEGSTTISIIGVLGTFGLDSATLTNHLYLTSQRQTEVCFQEDVFNNVPSLRLGCSSLSCPSIQ
ncbi:hypothetical protein OS493_015774 [Desmophyllum pertusum]|uniref:Uncharacterized protein n=1 Tax=Desmophyllum pertusum TaxID=174260 RepID=A0A9W9YE59_9CNID|nr:hypothetical protein OS493_015774 [Desmophyllum pertusum]